MSTLSQSRRLARVQTPIIPIVSRWMAETPGTVSLGQGMVAYGPPPEAIDALRGFPTHVSDNKYGMVEGQASLIRAFEEKVARENGIDMSLGRRAIVTAGSNQGFMNAILAITDPGDEVILPVPYYFNYAMAIEMAGATVVPVATDAAYAFDLDAIEKAITPRTRAVVTVSPGNPTGVVHPIATLRALNALCAKHGIFHIHDEVYEYFTYGDAKHESPAADPTSAPHTISLMSLSKAYGLASWRIGFMVFPEILWDAINKIQDTLLVCPPIVSQHVALAAMAVGRPYCDTQVAVIAQAREIVTEALMAPGVPCDVPAATGAFYYFIKVHTTKDSMEIGERLIREHRVAVIPGSAFGAVDGCYLRVSYGALDRTTAADGVGRLVSGLKALA